MKITKSNSRAKLSIEDFKGTTASKSVHKASSFQPLLQDNQARYTEEELKQLLESITGLGKQLSSQPNLQNLISYKRAVAEFLNKAADAMFKYKRESYFDRRWGRHNVYGIIKKVDEKLEALTRDIINQEKDHLLTVSLVDEIRGLLMDLLV